MSKICSECSSPNLHRGVALNASGVTVTASWSKPGLLGAFGYENVYTDICNDCGTIVRFYVENGNHPWDAKKR
jgi:hypothetical protein